MQPITTIIQLFKVSFGRPFSLKPGNVFAHNSPVLFRKCLNKNNHVLFYVQHNLETEFFRCLIPVNGRFGSRHIKIVVKAKSLLGSNQGH